MKKYLLVPPHSQSSPLSLKLSKLDEEMNEILNKRDIGEYTKASMYQDILNKYLDVKRQLDEPKPLPIVTKTTGDQYGTVDLTLFPNNMRNRAEHLLNHIRRDPNMNWNERGEILIHDRPIHGSHIIDVVKDLIQPAKKNSQGPQGIDTVVDVLRGSNVPMSLIGNKGRFQTAQASFDTMDELLDSPLTSTPKATKPPPRDRTLPTRTRHRPQNKSNRTSPPRNRQKGWGWMTL